eukprot:c37275_g1_i1 orf=76-237(-)
MCPSPHDHMNTLHTQGAKGSTMNPEFGKGSFGNWYQPLRPELIGMCETFEPIL